MSQSRAYSLIFTGLARRIRLEAIVDNGGTPMKVRALWDTGASSSGISERVITTLGLNKVGERDLIGANGGFTGVEYVVNIELVDLGNFDNHHVYKVDLAPNDADVLIGMDIISQFDSAITSNEKGETMFTLRYPSKQKVINFELEP